MADDGRSDTAGTLQQAVTLAHQRYDALQAAVTDTELQLTDIIQKKKNFDSNHEATVMWLRGVDKELRLAESLPVIELLSCSTVKVCVTYRLVQVTVADVLLMWWSVACLAQLSL